MGNDDYSVLLFNATCGSVPSLHVIIQPWEKRESPCVTSEVLQNGQCVLHG